MGTQEIKKSLMESLSLKNKRERERIRHTMMTETDNISRICKMLSGDSMIEPSILDGCTYKSHYSDIVYLVELKDGTEIVTKKIRNISFRGTLERALNEIRAGMLLKGKKGVSQYLYFFPGKSRSSIHLAFDPVNGFDLMKIMETRNYSPFDEGTVKKIVRQLIDILEMVHSYYIAHLDIKLENVMMNPETHEITLIDFGLCEFAAPNQKISCWSGSQDYAAPEILFRESFNPFSADIYSLGVLIYTLLFGELPFNFQDKVNALQDIGVQPPIVWPELPVAPIAKIMLGRMLQDDPRDRPSLSEVKDDLWFHVENTADGKD